MNAPEKLDLVSIRASSLAELFDCPARWSAKHLDGKRLPRSAAAQLGTAVHASTAVFDTSRLDGGSPVTADDAAGALVDAIHHPEEDVDWGDAKPQDAERIGLVLHAKYCSDIAPHQKYLGVEVSCERLEIPDLGVALTGTTDRVRETADGRVGISDLKTGGRAVGADGTVTPARLTAAPSAIPRTSGFRTIPPTTRASVRASPDPRARTPSIAVMPMM